MSEQTFISYAQNREDVVLWRALGNIPEGRYIEVGANDPTIDSITRAFYDHGWSGLTVEPITEWADRHRVERPRDRLVQAAVTSDAPGQIVIHHIPGTGLSTLRADVSDRHASDGRPTAEIMVDAVRLDTLLDEAGWAEADIHFMIIDTEGAERLVLESIDLERWRPWVLVIEATAPLTRRPSYQEWEHLVTEVGYEFCLFDGLSRFYVADECPPTIKEALSYPACIFDDYRSARVAGLERDFAAVTADRDRLRHQLIDWRNAALSEFARVAAANSPGPASLPGVDQLQAEIDALHETVSWKVTKPLRTLRASAVRRKGKS